MLLAAWLRSLRGRLVSADSVNWGGGRKSRRGAARLSSSNVEALEARVVLTVTLESAQNPPAPPTGSEMEASPRPYWDGIYTGLHGRTIVPGVSLGADDVLNSHTTLTGSVPTTASATLGTQVLTSR